MTTTSSPVYLSVVIPAYNESVNFKSGVLEQVLVFLNNQTYHWELIFVDDGSTDDTYSLLSGFVKKHSGSTLHRITHSGKAAAVIVGVAKAAGKVILFTDFDQSTPLSEVNKFIKAHEQGADVVIAHRSNTHKDTFIRKIRSWAYSTLVQLVALPQISDSQCGFKSFTNSTAKKIFPRLTIGLPKGSITGGYMGAFDVEVLFIAQKLKLKIVQLPVEWTKYQSDRLNIWRDPWLMLIDTFKVRIYDILGKYNAI